MSIIGDGPIGEFELGGFDIADAFSEADALESLLSSPWLEREWLFRAQPRDADTSTDPPTLLNVDLSTSGHQMFPVDAGYPDVDGVLNVLQLAEAVILPYSLAFGLEGQLWGVVSTTVGDIVIDDSRDAKIITETGGSEVPLRSLADEDWIGRNVDVHVGPRRGRQSQFGKVAVLNSRQISYDRSTLTVIVDDYSFIFGRPLQTNFFAGTGGLEGTAEIEGRPKPLVLGKVRQCEPILVDGVTTPSNPIYQIHDGSIQSISSVDVAGLALVFDADVADITTATPAAGEFSTSLATGYVMLGAKPDGVVTCSEVEGHNSSSFGYVETVGGLTKLLAVTFAGLDETAELDAVAFNAIELSFDAIMGGYFTAPVTIRDALIVFQNSALTTLWLRPEKVLTIRRITDPSAATADFALDAGRDDIAHDPWEVLPFEIPIGRVFVGYRRYSRRLSDTEVDASVSLTVRRDLSQEYRFATAEDLPTFVQIEDAREIVILTNLDDVADAQTIADEQLALRKGLRSLATFSLRSGLIKRGMGDVLELTDDRLPTSPKRFVVLDVVNEAAHAGAADVITVVCFG